MDEKRKGEISVKLLKYIGKSEPIYLKKDYAKLANELGISEEEFKEYYKEVIGEIIDEQ